MKMWPMAYNVLEMILQRGLYRMASFWVYNERSTAVWSNTQVQLQVGRIPREVKLREADVQQIEERRSSMFQRSNVLKGRKCHEVRV